MKSENGVFLKESQESLDSRWFRRFEEVGAFAAYEYLDGDKVYREEQKRQFVEGALENPVLDYPKIDLEKLEKDEQGLLALKKEILEQEKNETVRQVYRWRINEKLAELRMLRAVAVGDMKRFQKYSEFVYGKPSPEIFAYTIQNLKLKYEKHLSSENEEVRAAAEALFSALPQNLEEAKMIELPGGEIVKAVQEQTMKELGDLIQIESPDDGKQYTAEEIHQIFTGALETLRADGWSVVIDTGSKTAISVDQEAKTIKIPESRKVSFHKLKTLIAHEIGTHVARRMNGERSKLQLLGLGLDRYEKGEEGIARMREQVFEDEVDEFTGFEGHFSIGLAYGTDGKPRNFREVYDISQKYYYFKAMIAKKAKEDPLDSSQTSAWNRTLRTFRGSDCKTSGVCFTKDIIYREGNIDVWRAMKENPSEMMRLSVGKYDPANDRHLWILNQLGITEADLKELE